MVINCVPQPGDISYLLALPAKLIALLSSSALFVGDEYGARIEWDEEAQRRLSSNFV